MVIASKARSSPIPLPLVRVCGLRGTGPPLADEAQGEEKLSRVARGVMVIASKARSGPIPLPLVRASGGSQPHPSTSEVGRFLRKRRVRRHGPL